LATAESGWLVKLLVFAAKMAFFIFFYMLVRWTIPRFRFDQLMALAWKVLIPLGVANLLCGMVVRQLGLAPGRLLPAALVLRVAAGGVGPMREPVARVPGRVEVGGAAEVEAVTRGG